MTRPRKPWIDWRREREAISRLIKNRGGVLRIQASPAGPLFEFANALRSHLDDGKWPYPWTTIQFDPENSDTRYFGEMTRQIERSLSLPPELVPPISLGDGSKLGSEITATTINITDSFNFGLAEYERAVTSEWRARRIVQTLKERVDNQSYCFLFVHSEDFLRQDLASFRDLLWLKGLQELTLCGVLLVDITRCDRRTDIDWPPPPDLNLSLAEQYDEDTREDAIDDLSQILLESGLETTEPEARAYSRAMLDNHKSATTLYAQLAGVFASRGSAI